MMAGAAPLLSTFMFQSKTLEDNISLPDDDDNGIGLISSKEVNYF
jgi:hypothetical protein